MPRKKKTKQQKGGGFQADPSEKEMRQTPRAFVIKRGEVPMQIKDLVQDFRNVMSPNTAKRLRESKLNRIEDYVAVAGPLFVSHLVVFTQTKSATYMKLVKLPAGPTLTFKVDKYTLAREVRSAQKRQRLGNKDFESAALQVLSGFSGPVPPGKDGAKATPTALISEMFKGLFPAVHVPTFNQAEMRRVALFSYDAESEAVWFRHYTIAKKQAGLERSVTKLLRSTRPPKLTGHSDIADWVLGGGGAASESEMEQPAEAPGISGKQIGVKLTEIGPRLRLTLIKAEEGVCNGTVMYHKYLTKTPTQLEILEEKANQRRKLKARNDLLTKKFGDVKLKRKLARDKKKQQETEGGDLGEEAQEFVGSPAQVREEKEADKAVKKKYHPLGYGRKKNQQKAAAAASANAGEAPAKASGSKRPAGGVRTMDRFQETQKKQKTA